jgi:hypothetical protein
MDWITIGIGVVAAIAGVGWAALFVRGRMIWNEMKEIRTEYQKAIKDNVITDAEKAAIADRVIKAIQEAASIWQALENLALEIKEFIEVRRAAK